MPPKTRATKVRRKVKKNVSVGAAHIRSKIGRAHV